MENRISTVRSVVAARLLSGSPENLDDETPLVDLGLDSVSLITIAAELQRRTGAIIPDEVLFHADVTVSSLAASLVGEENASSEKATVKVVGMGVVGPTGQGLTKFWESMRAEYSNRVPAPYDNPRQYMIGAVPNASPGEISDPSRLFLLACEAGREALNSSKQEDRPATQVVVGTTDTGGNALRHALVNPDQKYEPLATARVAERVAEALGLQGGATLVASASASGAVALGYALDLLRAGESEQVLVIGVDTVSETGFHGLAALRTLSPSGCRPFSAERSGIAISEAASAILLRRDDSKSNMLARGSLAGYGASSYTTHMAAPESAGIEIAIRRALANAGIAPSDIDLINTHGPGTKLGDVAELNALRTVFGDALPRIPINSSKGLLWHCQGAAGVIESQVCIMSLQSGILTPTVATQPLDSQWDDVDVVDTLREHTGTYAMSISCGLGGVNTALVWGKS